VRVVPSIAVFGIGHVGLELARILARQHVELHLVDSREAMLQPSRLGVQGFPGPLADAIAQVEVHDAPVPESVLREVPPGTHVLVMTHDHAEDLAIVDQALRTEGVASIGLIGSRSKWARFRARLHEAGHDDDALARVTTPIGLPGVPGKQPATIAVSVAAQLLQLIEQTAPVPRD
jgi:xanthine dehydrogenase accessory protein XdhC